LRHEPDLIEKILFIGAESTGKSTLAALVSKHLKTVCVPEYGRTFWVQKSGQITYEDMLLVASRQIEAEEFALKIAKRFLVCDTCPLTTYFYSYSQFGKVDPRLQELSNRQYHYVFLCMPDTPFVQDGTRSGALFRFQQHDWYVRELNRRRWAYTAVSGSPQQRLSQILQKITEVR
jgi:HTH-type transcriptional repressor of NAD biosynthesis genes